MTLQSLDLHLNGTGITAQRDLMEGVYLIFRASSIREERTGVHACLEIYLGPVVLAWTTCNVERDEDRLRLSNRAIRLLPKEKRGDYQPDFLKHDLDYFCRHLWTTFLSQIKPAAEPGLAVWEPEYILEPYIIDGGGTILYASPGAGKSYISLLMAQSVNRCKDTFWPVEYRETLFVNLERSAQSVRGRLGRVNHALGLATEDPLHILAGRGRNLAALAPAIESYIAEHDIRLLVLDSLSRTGMGGLTLPEEVNPVINLLNRLCPTWLALAHTPRASDERVYGGQMWDAGADILAQLRSQPKEGKLGISLTITKANDIAIPPPALWEISFPTEDQAFSVRPTTRKEYPELAARYKGPVINEIEDYLLEAGKATPTQIAQQLDKQRTYINSILKSDPRFTRVGSVGPKGQVYYGVKSPVSGV